MSCIFKLLFLLKKLQYTKDSKRNSTTSHSQIQQEIQQFLSSENMEEIIDVLEESTSDIRSCNEPLSPMVIGENYTIYLSDYKVEIKLSHLTKAIYLLFLKHPEGIHLPKLKVYKKELFDIYKCISYQTSLKKMQQTINNLVAFKNNEIYTHLYRIKREFHKKLPEKIAYNYCIEEKKMNLRGITASCFTVLYKVDL